MCKSLQWCPSIGSYLFNIPLFRISFTNHLSCCCRVTSIVTVFVNKALFSSINLDAPLFITWFQCIISVAICLCLKVLSQFYPNLVTFSDGRLLDGTILRKVQKRVRSLLFPKFESALNVNLNLQVFPLSVLFTSMIATNNLCLKYVDVSFYYIGRSLTTVFNVALSYMLLRQTSSRSCILCCAVIVSGFWLGVDQESLSSNTKHTICRKNQTQK